MSGLGESLKFKLRRAKIKELEQEQEQEDRASLDMTTEQREVLNKTFASVQMEFEDLDGLSWDRGDAKKLLLDWVCPEGV
jgi:hypothetical protein